MSVERLRSLFMQKQSLRARFEAAKEVEWESLVDNLENQIDASIVALRQSKKLKVAEMGRMLGTSDFNTAKRRINTAFERATNVVPDTHAISAETFVWNEVSPGSWTATDAVGRVVKLAILEEQQAVVVQPGSDKELVPMFADSPEMGFLLWKNQTQDQS